MLAVELGATLSMTSSCGRISTLTLVIVVSGLQPKDNQAVYQRRFYNEDGLQPMT